MDATFLLIIGSFLLTVELLCLQQCLGAFLLTIEAFHLQLKLFYLQLKLFYLQWKVSLIRTWVDFKQTSSTVSKKAPTATKKAPPPPPQKTGSLEGTHVRIQGFLGHAPSTAGTFRKNSGKTPETLSERFLEFPSRVRRGSPKPYNSRHLRLPEHFQNSLPTSTAGDASFFRSGSGEGLLFTYFASSSRGPPYRNQILRIGS